MQNKANLQRGLKWTRTSLRKKGYENSPQNSATWRLYHAEAGSGFEAVCSVRGHWS
jgi:hypothetical protein